MRRRLVTGVVVLAAVLAAPGAAMAVEPGVVFGPRTGPATIDQNAQAAASGAAWVRVFVEWAALEPSRGQYAFGAYDRTIDEARRRGQRVLVVVTASPGWASGSNEPNRPPTAANVSAYAETLGVLARRYAGRVSAWEIWNEPDEPKFWSPEPDPLRYTDMLRQSYAAVKRSDPAAIVVSGGLVGNHFRFLEQLYAAGAQGSFDAVGVHLDTACRTAPPEESYREPDGRLGRFAFTGYREVRQTMLARGDDKPIWMTELGWSTTPEICSSGDRAGTKPGGVSRDEQADFLTRAYRCMQRDRYLQVALWFSLQDVDSRGTYDYRLGLIDDNGARKPAFDAFRAFATAPDRPQADCGEDVDATAPVVTLLAPRAGQPYLDELRISAHASDDQRVVRMELWVDGRKIRASQKGGRFRLDWQGAKRLTLGRHTIAVRAIDRARNVGQASAIVEKADPDTLRVGPAQLDFTVRRSRRARTLVVSGRVRAPGSPVRPKGRVRMFFARRTSSRGRAVFRPTSRYTKGAARPFTLRVRLRQAGTWRVHARYAARKPFRPVRSAPVVVLVR